MVQFLPPEGVYVDHTYEQAVFRRLPEEAQEQLSQAPSRQLQVKYAQEKKRVSFPELAALPFARASTSLSRIESFSPSHPDLPHWYHRFRRRNEICCNEIAHKGSSSKGRWQGGIAASNAEGVHIQLTGHLAVCIHCFMQAYSFCLVSHVTTQVA